MGFIGVAEEADNTFVLLVTERLQCSLRDILKSEENIPTWPIRISFANDIAKALAFLHAKGIIHRGMTQPCTVAVLTHVIDIKSKNLLVYENNKVKLCDFSFARTGSPNRRQMTICGTEGWMVCMICDSLTC